MAVFLLNHCKFNGCGLSFPNLLELIQHIEDTHIDTLTDPAKEAVQETQQPSCLPLSSVLRFFNPTASKATSRKHLLTNRASGGPQAKLPKLSHVKNPTGSHGKSGKCRSSPSPTTITNTATTTTTTLPIQLTHSPHTTPVKTGGGGSGGSSIGTPSSTRESTPVSAVSNSPPVSDGEDCLQSDNEDSNDSWTTQDEIPAEVIIKLASRGHTGISGEDKPYVCPVMGCRKKYKNINGIKYHARNAHKKDSNRVRKPYRCYCGKSYCTGQGLRNHSSHAHKSEKLTSVTTNTGEVLQVPTNHLSTTTHLINNNINNNNINTTSTKTSVVPVSKSTENEVSVEGNVGNNQITVTGQIIKGGSHGVAKGSTTISSINLTGLVTAAGNKIALKALPNGQLLLSQPLEGKLAALVKSEANHDYTLDDNKNNLVQLKTDGLKPLELGKLLQTSTNKSSHQQHHQLAVTTSTISVALPASTFNSLKNPQRTGLMSSAMLARALKSQLSSTATTVPSVLGTIDNQSNTGNVLGSQGVILGVTMEEGTLVDNGDGTLSELSVID
ncbi:hypothetical protein Pmani_012605 [Petrolisthes manimaculis]|uniref:C2H2-type domain-containing protein n=1 Tax=Petrolisthes manimaculis TaxID=1843537 RepID=A0AAE1PXH2_9EUCA|nr:hypothetical protein Pmani_012605 [Petrolisthes manimaculis]